MNFTNMKSPIEMTDLNASLGVNERVPPLSVSSSSGNNDKKPTSSGALVLDSNDVLSGRSQLAHNHPGNRHFRSLVAEAVPKYTAASSNLQKGNIVSAVIDEVHASGGRFLKQDGKSGNWVELGDQEAKSKVAHAIRDKTANFEARSKRVTGSGASRKAFKSQILSKNPHKEEDESRCNGKAAAPEPSLFFLKQFNKAPTLTTTATPKEVPNHSSLGFPQLMMGGDDVLDCTVQDNGCAAPRQQQHGGSFLDGFLGISVEKCGRDNKYQLSSRPEPRKTLSSSNANLLLDQLFKEIKTNTSQVKFSQQQQQQHVPSVAISDDDDFSDAEFLDKIDEILF